MSSLTQANLIIINTAKELVELANMRRKMEISKTVKKYAEKLVKDNEQKKR